MKQKSQFDRNVNKINEGYEKAIEDGGENVINLEKMTKNLEAKQNAGFSMSRYQQSKVTGFQTS